METGIPIRKLSELTGVAPTTLRAWERRYDLFTPNRTETGHRLYSHQDVQTIKQVVVLMAEGRSISEAVVQLKQPAETSSSENNQWTVVQQKLRQAISQFDEHALENGYNQALSLYPFSWVCRELLLPTLVELGQSWQQKPLGVLQEHFFTAYLRNKLGARLHHEAQRKHGNLLIIACLPNEIHELGALLFSLEALGHGYRVLYLGANTPLAQLPALATQLKASALVLSGTVIQAEQLDWQCLNACPVPIFVGGQFAAHNEDWIRQHHATPLPQSTELAIQSIFARVSPYTRGV